MKTFKKGNYVRIKGVGLIGRVARDFDSSVNYYVEVNVRTPFLKRLKKVEHSQVELLEDGYVREKRFWKLVGYAVILDVLLRGIDFLSLPTKVVMKCI